MKWFRWLKRANNKIVAQENNATDEWQLALSPEALLVLPIYQTKLHELKQLISVTLHYYQTLYLSLIHAVASVVQQLPHPDYLPYKKANGFLLAAFDLAIAALKLRRGYMLPLGADTETCYREQDVWSYAIFTAALLQHCWLLLSHFQIAIKPSFSYEAHLWNPLITPTISAKQYYRFKLTPLVTDWRSANPLLAKLLLSEQAFTWLCSYPHLFTCWWQCIAGISNSNNPLQEILQKAHTHLLFMENEPIVKESVVNTQEAKLTNTLESNAAEVKTNDSLEINPFKKNHSTQNSSINDLLISTLRQQLEKKNVEINQLHSFIHRVHEGILLIIPAIWEWLLSHCPELKAQLIIQPQETIDSTLLQALSEENQLIKNSAQNSLLHRYFIGRWEARQVLAGIVVPVEALFSDSDLPAINEQLHLEPAL